MMFGEGRFIRRGCFVDGDVTGGVASSYAGDDERCRWGGEGGSLEEDEQ